MRILALLLCGDHATPLPTRTWPNLSQVNKGEGFGTEHSNTIQIEFSAFHPVHKCAVPHFGYLKLRFARMYASLMCSSLLEERVYYPCSKQVFNLVTIFPCLTEAKKYLSILCLSAFSVNTHKPAITYIPKF